jgi:hypothetical protein
VTLSRSLARFERMQSNLGVPFVQVSVTAPRARDLSKPGCDKRAKCQGCLLPYLAYVDFMNRSARVRSKMGF